MPATWYGGHADQLGLVLVGAEELDGGEDVGGQVPVAQHRGLRLAGGAAREQQDGDVLGVDERQVVVDRRRARDAVGQQLVAS